MADNLSSLIPGHMSVRDYTSDWEEVIHVIRLKHPKTPIFVFGGHNHIRDCKRPDENSIIMASGRYMETVGWVSYVAFIFLDPHRCLHTLLEQI